MRARILVVVAIVTAMILVYLVVRPGPPARSAGGSALDAAVSERPRRGFDQAPAARETPRRQPVRSEASDSGATREGSIEIAGHVVLGDGSPGDRLHLVALAEGAERGEELSARGRARSPLLVGETWTDPAGAFAVTLESDDPPDGFELRQITHSRIGQSSARYGWTTNTSIRHVIPGGRLRVRVVDPNGVDASGVKVEARFFDPEAPSGDPPVPRQRTTGSDGVAEFHFNEAAVVDLVATRIDDGATATRRGLPVDARTPTGDCTLALAERELTGALYVEVVDEHGGVVSDYAVEVSAVDGSFGPRFVDSRDVGASGRIPGIPEGRVVVTLAPRFGLPPSLYSTDPPPGRTVDVAAGATSEVRLVVALGSRMAFELDRETSDDGRLGVRYRREETPRAPWQVASDLWVYFESGGGRVSSWMEDDGVYYTDRIRPGAIEVQVFDLATEEVLWSDSLSLSAGTIPRVSVPVR